MSLLPETKMVDARKHSVSGTHWSGEPHGQCLKICPHFNFMEPTLWHVFSKNALSSNTLSLFHISFIEPTNSLQCDFLREHYHSLISTNSRQPPQKCIRHTNSLFLIILCRWDFFQPRKQKFRRTTERNKQ